MTMKDIKILSLKSHITAEKNLCSLRTFFVFLLMVLSLSVTSCSAWKWTKERLKVSEKKENKEELLKTEQEVEDEGTGKSNDTPAISGDTDASAENSDNTPSLEVSSQRAVEHDSLLDEAVVEEEVIEPVEEREDSPVSSSDSIDEIITKAEAKEELRNEQQPELISETSDFSIVTPAAPDMSPEETSRQQASISATAANNSPKTHIISITYGAVKFVPEKIVINVGDTVKWDNKDTTLDAHIFQSVPASNPFDKENDEIDLTYLYAGKTFSHTFEKIGVYPYFCFIHRGMRGEITVVKPGQRIEDMKKEVLLLTSRKKTKGSSRKKLEAKEMVLIPEGKFIMGSPEVAIDGPVHLEYLPAYYIDKYEVTNEEYEEFIDSSGYTPEGKWRDSYQPGMEKYPVVNVTYKDAEAYAKWAGKRLPTEQEWEKAARGTDRRIWPWGDEFDNEIPNIFGPDEYSSTSPVGVFEEDVTPYGVFDMAGNVSEWTSDPFLPYEGSDAADHPDFSPDKKVIRGGSFSIVDEMQVAAHSRKGSLPSRSFNSLGFRLAKDKTE